MLFYNHKQEFIGINEEGLKLLNYSTLEELLGVCNDVADLFAKEPGYIHNFKNFGWIDFLLHADSDAKSAIVHGNGRTFSCTLSLSRFYLCSEPSQPGFMIEFEHVQLISGETIKVAPATHSFPHPIKENVSITSTMKEMPSEKFDILPDYTHVEPATLNEPSTFDIPVQEATSFYPFAEEQPEITVKAPVKETEPFPEQIVPKKADIPMLGDIHYSSAEQEYIDHHAIASTYKFDPTIAANELGLPVDLIEEFIGDFIQQSHDFKDDLFDAVLKGDINNLKILSHKLKGVAANLRIEDAFETLSIINTSGDMTEIEANLKYFYTIIAKLEGKEVPVYSPSVSTVSSEPTFKPADTAAEDEIYDFALKTDQNVSSMAEEEPSVNLDEPLYTLNDNIYSTIDSSEGPSSFSNNSYEGEVPAENLQVFQPEEEPITLENEPEYQIVPEEPVFVETQNTHLHYDRNSIASQLGIEVGFFNEIIEEYHRDALKASDAITQAIGAFDTHAWQATARQLRGISDNLRLTEISDELAVLSDTNDAQEANKASKRLNALLEQL